MADDSSQEQQSVFLNIKKKMGPEPSVSVWFTWLPFYMSAVFLLFAYLIQYSMTSVGISGCFISFFQLVIPLLFLMYSILLIVIGLLKEKLRSRSGLYSSSMFLLLAFVLSLLALFANTAFSDGQYTLGDYSYIYLVSIVISTIDVFYLCYQIRRVVVLMIGVYHKEEIANSE